jgi:hypothetical protein
MRLLRRLLTYLLLLILLSFPVFVFLNAQALSDWWQLRNYSAPESISKLADQDDMSKYARHIFYVNHPQLQSNVTQFRNDCNEDEKTIILGCYHSNQMGIC